MGGGRWTWGMGENVPLLKGAYSRNEIETDTEVSKLNDLQTGIFNIYLIYTYNYICGR